MDFYCSSQLTIEQALLNRGMLFAESPFTTLLSSRGRFLFLSEHFERLKNSYQYLYQREDWKEWEQKVYNALQGMKNSQGLSSYRITFFETLEDHQIHFFIFRKGVSEEGFGALSLGLAKKTRSVGVMPIYFKHGNYCEINMELRQVKERGFDDVLFLDYHGFVKECSTSNIFFRKGEVVYTPRLEEGLLGGITRANLIKCLKEKDIQIEQIDFTLKELFTAEEIWVTSAIKGIRMVSSVEEHKFQTSTAWSLKVVEQFKKYCGLV